MRQLALFLLLLPILLLAAERVCVGNVANTNSNSGSNADAVAGSVADVAANSNTNSAADSASSDVDFEARLEALEREKSELERHFRKNQSTSEWFRFSQTTDENPLARDFASSYVNMSLDDLEAELARTKNWQWKKDSFTITPFAWVWLTGSYETNQTSPGEYPLFVRPRFGDDERAHSNFDMKATRLGMIATAPEVSAFPDVQISGVFEIDFQGKYFAENEADIELRKGYFEMKNDEFLFLVGQTWEVIKPIHVTMLNWGGAVGGGSCGFRRPMIRYDRYFKRENGRFAIQGAILSSNTAALAGTLNGAYDGKMASWPEVQLRIERTFDSFGPFKSAMFGIGGRWADKRYENVSDHSDQFDRFSWGIHAEAMIRFSDRAFISGEFFCGELLGCCLGAVIQDINPQTLESVGATGGWVAFSYDLTKELHYTMGLGIDDPWNSRLCEGMRGRNSVFYTNLSYDFTKQMNIGIEYALYSTQYVALGTARSHHMTLAVNFKF
ncbi:MAG: hypothetical protein Q4D38_11190 [Planctomycetia bacterium]|nr:hypothetical protein [Planctomycetia bacterium]